MFKYIIVAVLLFQHNAICAPTLEGLPAVKYLVYLAPNDQVPWHAIAKIEYPQAESVAQYDRLRVPNDVVVVYPNAPYTQYSVLQRDPHDFWLTVQSLIQSFGEAVFNFPFNLPTLLEPFAPARPSSDSVTPDHKLPANGVNDDDKKLDKNIVDMEVETLEPVNPLLPASTIPSDSGRRVLIINGEPNLFSNFGSLRQNPFLKSVFDNVKNQMLPPTVRSNVQTRSNEGIISDKLDVQRLQQQTFGQVPIVPQMDISPPLELRSNARLSLQSSGAVDQQISHVNLEDQTSIPLNSRSLKDTVINVDVDNKHIDRLEQEVRKQYGKLLADNPTAARVGPVGKAVSGVGGVAESAAIGSAITGRHGLALAVPESIAVAGDVDETIQLDLDGSFRTIENTY